MFHLSENIIQPIRKTYKQTTEIRNEQGKIRVNKMDSRIQKLKSVLTNMIKTILLWVIKRYQNCFLSLAFTGNEIYETCTGMLTSIK